MYNRTVRYPFSGLLKCAVCGSSIVAAGNDHGHRVGLCTRVRESGDCSNRRKIYLAVVEQAVIAALKEQLAQPEAITLALHEYRRENAERARSRFENERKLAERRRQVDRLVDQIADGVASGPAVGRKLAELEAEIADLEATLETAPEPDVITLHPKALDQYVSAINKLAASLGDGRDDEAMGMVRTMIDKITVYPRDRGKPVRFDITGDLIAFLDPSVGKVAGTSPQSSTKLL